MHSERCGTLDAMRTTLATRLTSGSIVLLAAATLAACGSSEQSKTDACIVVAEGLENVQSEIAGAGTALDTGDLLSVQANLAAASESLAALAPAVTNAQISPILTDLTAGLDAVRDAVTAAGTSDPDAAKEALQGSAGDLQRAATRFNEACGA